MRAILCIVCMAALAVWGKAAQTGATNRAASVTNGTNLTKEPQTLADLLGIAPAEVEKVDIARINLLCAEGLRGSEHLDVQQCLDTLDAWARHVQRETDRNFHHFAEHPEGFKSALAYYRMGMLGTVLAEDLRILYNPALEKVADKAIESRSTEKWNKFYTDSSDVFIHGLLGSKHYGTCSSMPFLYVAVGRRLGYPVNLAARKYHLYARYDEGNGEHFNLEATENRGFSTPSDEEYRTGKPSMTGDEIRGMGWLRPLSNREVLAICLLNRSSCLRSMGRYEDANAALDQAARYQPGTPLAKRVLQKNRDVNRILIAADRWDALWNELEGLLAPTGGLMADHFRTRRAEVQFLMNQSTNIAEIERSVRGLKQELARYRAEISDDSAQIHAAFGPAQPSVQQQKFARMLADAPQRARVPIPREAVPSDYYWHGVPPDLQKRLAKLGSPGEIIEEMNVFHGEETSLRNLESQQAATHAGEEASLPPGWQAQEHVQLSQLGVRPENLPPTYRNMEIPPELQRRLVIRTQNLSAGREQAALDEIRRFQGDQLQRRLVLEAIQKRRRILEQQSSTRPPLEIEIVDSEQTGAQPEGGHGAQKEPVLPVTAEPQSIVPTPMNGKGKP